MAVPTPDHCMITHPYACANCFRDEALRQFIAENAIDCRCGYCGRRADTPIAADIGEVTELIEESLEFEWTDPGNELPWDSAEGGWQLVTPMSTDDLIRNEETFANEDTPAYEAIEADVVGSIGLDRQWVKRNFIALRRHEALILGWSKFSQLIIAQQTGERIVWPTQDDLEPGEIAPQNILQEIGKLAKAVSIDPILPAGSHFWRARRHNLSDSVTTAAELGSAPAGSAMSNRMSRAGVSMFYGSVERSTAIAEARESKPYVTVGRFETARNLRIIDLTRLPQVPSIYDRERRELRPAIRFFKSFGEAIKKPVKPGNATEYLPTQLVTEFFRDEYRTSNGEPVLGILYPSAQGPGSCCVLFFDSAGCTDLRDHWADSANCGLGLANDTLTTAPFGSI